MEPLPHTYTANSEVASADLNAIQQTALGARPADSNNLLANGTPVTPDGSTETAWIRGITGSDIGTGALVVVDTSLDWRDRILRVEYAELGAIHAPGETDDYLFDATPTARVGYTGLGALGAASAAVTAGTPPVPAAGTSWALEIATNLWLYAVPSTGVLSLYNDTGSTIWRAMLFVCATAQTGLRP